MNSKDIIRNLLQENIVLATGCTEPVAVALCVAKAKELLEELPAKVELFLSKNIIKNAMGVGIPGTGMIGLPIAISLGVVCGDSKKGLDVLSDVAEHVEKAKQWLENNSIDIKQTTTPEKLYIECRIYGKHNTATAIIAYNHLNFIHLQKNNDILYRLEQEDDGVESKNEVELHISAKDVYQYAIEAPLVEISWVMDTATVNAKASEIGMQGDYGLQLGKILYNDEDNSLRKRVIAKTCAASDARMEGAPAPVYSNSGSGNQGITCTIPVYEFGKELGCSVEEINRALVLSNLMNIYLKQHIGKLSALCGIVNASIGVACGFVYLQGGDFTHISYVIKNMINTITGMVCDGAKPSCALKISTGLNAAFDCSTIAIRGIVVNETDGLSEDSLERSIGSLGRIGRYGMDATDELTLEIMTNKIYCNEKTHS
ncbi:MAG: L-serine ammonia-lyase, iron-sulfur-dependent, subunit alpha [Bacteroidetes bacterium]|nr:L-serine ammonia-lyase, iron-sulfur-dependent, subunit alpha [Bacteroidota bacterium]MCL2302117.1 L-serine ammonia-lyase, iron-sulfur-dependent, subunit alpha [Lentimicrobiaceae bacterium]